MAANIERKDFLIMIPNGEKFAKEEMSFMTHTDVLTGKIVWEKATSDYSFNPFGKLVKKPARILPNGAVFEHKKHYHGWFATLLCTVEFYEKHKDTLDKYITTDAYFDKKWLPKTY
tara:strand:+ start:2523 stop:2870 length:348 start_codon:yes stop_codon:yes gene_type:complete